MNYDKMEETVQKLCYSLVHEPERWEIGVHTLEDIRTGVEYWIRRTSMTELWSGRSTSHVFSYEQGIRVRQAFEKLCVIKATRAQEKVLRSLGSASPQQPQQPSLWSRLLSRLSTIRNILKEN